MPTRVRSYSKINLGLAVGPARADGFHALTTCYQTLEAHDLVTVTARTAQKTHITLDANHPGVPCTRRGDCEKNTAHRIVALALSALGVSAEVHIEIDKRLPVQGGLGAGSANAAAALIALEQELQAAGLGMAKPVAIYDRLALAAEVGSDVSLFLVGGTVLGLNRGEEVYPLPDLPAMPCVLAIPEVGVSTALAFRELDARMQAAGSLPNSPQADKLKELSHALSSAFSRGRSFEPGLSGIACPAVEGQRGDLALNAGSPASSLDGVLNPLLTLVRTGIENDFEEVAFSQHPSLRSTKRDLMGSGSGAAVYAALSGSGSALFGLYASSDDALAAQQRVQANGTRAIVTKTLARSAYWHTMFAE